MTIFDFHWTARESLDFSPAVWGSDGNFVTEVSPGHFSRVETVENRLRMSR